MSSWEQRHYEEAGNEDPFRPTRNSSLLDSVLVFGSILCGSIENEYVYSSKFRIP